MPRCTCWTRWTRCALVAVLAVICLAAWAPEARADHRENRCVSDCDCPEGELCNPRTATCGPVACPRLYAPVCGLDGVTYANDCLARAAHIVVADEGPCPKTCGGLTGKRCDEGQVCDLPAGMCKGADLEGVCKDRPEACPENFDPVCGCDGKTYGNDCERLRAGAQKAHDGACRDQADRGAADLYRCTSNDDCSRSAYCNIPKGQCRGAGSCDPRPELCPQIFLPVCGCDGRTYGNACEAAAAGVSVRQNGEC